MASMSDPLHSVAIYWCLCAVEWVLSRYSQATSPDSPHPLLSPSLSHSLARDRHSCQIKINRILKDVRAKYFILALGTN